MQRASMECLLEASEHPAIEYIKIYKTCLLYRAETWTLKKELLDSTYTRLLMRVQNICMVIAHDQTIHLWKHSSYPQLLNEGCVLLGTAAVQRPVSDVICWRLLCANRGHSPLNYIDTISKDTECEVQDLPSIRRNKNHSVEAK